MSKYAYDLGSLNLDCMTLEEVDELHKHLMNLVVYTMQKATAMRRRLNGDILVALELERTCETIYDQLPDNWKW